ncbi:PIN domain-containing protein [Oribacterium sinus]|uniref:PIN domain-containing protein n=1 Tax=Oribacterium sinus TaxID=237576 RepID=UPI0028EE9CA6|nr:PIN domain-containing protein [Oribacterium sinus]
MIFLVDFENTHASGFEGYHYLTEQDTLVVYYSDENSALQKGVVEDLKEKAVHVRMVKLLKQHSNALDMYIASTTGMFLDTGEKICIVSKDKGYAAVRDFWHSLRGAEILLGETIEECFLHSVANDDERIRRAKERNQKVQLIDAFETTNNVPTRPTLSYRNNYRRRKNQFLDVSSHLEPVELLPNPLAKEDVSYASLVEEENDGEHFSVDYSASIKEEKLYPDEEHVESFEKELSSDRATEETVAAKGKEDLDSREEAKTADNTKPEEVKHEDSSKSSVETVNRIYPKTEKKANAGRPSNQIQYIYDPVLKRMKRVDVEEVAEDSISETGAEESKKTEEKKSSDAGDEAVQEDASAVTENRPVEQRERQRHHNRRRRRSNGKKDNGTQASGQNSNQESSQDNTKAVSQDSAKVEAKDNAKTVAKDYAKTEAKDNSKEHGKDASKEESKSIKEQKPEKQEKVETKEKSGKSDKVVKEKKSARKTGTKASQEKHVEKSAEDSAKASTKEEKKQNQTPEKKAKVKDADKSVESKTDLKTTKEKPLRKSVKAKIGEEKSETKSTRAKTAEKTDKTKAGEKTNTTKEEKTAKTKTGARTSNDKTAEKSVKAKADAKKTESVSAEKPGRRGRKKKEETKETDK